MVFNDPVETSHVAVAPEDPPGDSFEGLFKPAHFVRRAWDDMPSVVRALLTGYDEA